MDCFFFLYFVDLWNVWSNFRKLISYFFVFYVSAEADSGKLVSGVSSKEELAILYW